MFNKKIEKNQEKFFNDAAAKETTGYPFDPFLMNYINKEQHLCFDWIANQQKLLDYGCGNAESVDILLERHPKGKFVIYGVDIAEMAVKNAQNKYPKYHFYTIKNNKIPQIKSNSMDGGYMIHVLHHAEGHQQIFNEISAKLKPGGKFFLNDLTSQNVFIRIGRLFFTLMPRVIQQKFSDDLVVDGVIPDKYKIDIHKIKNQLEKAGFKVETIGYGHLFFFLFCWIERFIPFSKLFLIRWIYSALIKLEKILLQFSLFQCNAEVVYILATKHAKKP